MTGSDNPMEAMARAGLDAAQMALDAYAGVLRQLVAMNPLLSRQRDAGCGCGGCEIPPACWLPRDLGELARRTKHAARRCSVEPLVRSALQQLLQVWHEEGASQPCVKCSWGGSQGLLEHGPAPP